MKKGQIALFLIFLVVILIAVGIGFHFFNNSVQEKTDLPSADVSDIEQVVSDCLRSTVSDGVRIIGWQGGYYEQPLNSFLGEFTFIPVFYENRIVVPKKSDVESQISLYIEDHLSQCVNNSLFVDAKIQMGMPVANTVLLSDSVHTLVNLPVRIFRANQESVLNSFESDVPYRMTEFLALSKTITNIYAKKPGYICMNCLDSLMSNRTRILVTPYFSLKKVDNYFRVSIQDVSSVNNDTFRFALVIPEDFVPEGFT